MCHRPGDASGLLKALTREKFTATCAAGGPGAGCRQIDRLSVSPQVGRVHPGLLTCRRTAPARFDASLHCRTIGPAGRDRQRVFGECANRLGEATFELALGWSAMLPPSSAPLRAGVLRTLKGAHIAFTGILSRPRRDAIRAARRAGATVHGGPSARTNVVVRGKPNPLQAAGRDAGVKLMEIKRLREKGHRIKLLNDAQFWALAATPGRRRKR